MTNRSVILSPSGAEIAIQIQTIMRDNEKISLCSFVLNCQHKQDASTLIINSDQTILGGILCDGVSESPNSGIFANFIVEKVRSRIISMNLKNISEELTSKQLEHVLNEIIQEFYAQYASQLESDEISPKSTFILYLSVLSPISDSNDSYYFFYLGDGKIAMWDNQSTFSPAEFLMEYHNETGVLLNALRKDLPTYTKQYPISRMIINTSKNKGEKKYVLFASDGFEPYYEDFLSLIQNHPEFWTIIELEKCEELQDMLVKEIFGGLKMIPNDDVSMIFVRYN